MSESVADVIGRMQSVQGEYDSERGADSGALPAPDSEWRMRNLRFDESLAVRVKFAVQVEEFFWRAFHRATDGHRILILQGPPGCGKTHLAGRVFDLLDRCRNSGMWDMWLTDNPPEVVFFEENHIQEKEHCMSLAMAADVLVLDDLGIWKDEFKSGKHVAKLCSLLNERLKRGKFTLITTNIEPKDWASHWDERVESRLLGRDLHKPKSRVLMYK